VSLVALLPAFLAGSAASVQLAITLGAVLLAAAALERVAIGFPRAAAAILAFRLLAPVLREGAERTRQEGPQLELAEVPDDGGDTAAGGQAHPAPDLLELRNVHYGGGIPVIRGCSLVLRRGEQVLLTGLSGCGKSTLAALIAGLRSPSSGHVLVNGLDRATLGAARWRRLVAHVLQDHENHVLSGTLAFNLLMGRPEPHGAQDLQEALEVCEELGLAPLIERMPAGLQQMVGETGWRLSHGERSRVFLARALLQGADLLILDESLGALDPDSYRRCLECIQRRAPTLLLIAHP
jgi:ATP-binding cassette subfamily B protein